MFSSKSLIVSGFTLRSLIHFEFIFVYGVRECSNFILLHVPRTSIFKAPILCPCVMGLAYVVLCNLHPKNIAPISS